MSKTKQKVAKKLSLECRRNGDHEGKPLSLNTTLSQISKLASSLRNFSLSRRRDCEVSSPLRMRRGVRGEGLILPDADSSSKKRCAFTLAEVLITLGIIGAVAAITMPTLIQNHKKAVVETKLKKFYTTFNQAVSMSIIQNGELEYWNCPRSSDTNTKEISETCFEKYIAPYIKILKSETLKTGSTYRTVMYMPDGSVVIFSTHSSILFYPFARDYIRYPYGQTEELVGGGSKFFTFNMFFNNTNKRFGPWEYNPNTTDINRAINDSTQGCRANISGEHAMCAKFIQLNGWKIPKDYPFKF